MKKHLKILKHCIIPIALLSIATSASLFVVSCSATENFIANTYTTNAQDLKTLAIDVENRNVTINSSDDNQIKIEYFYSTKEYYNIMESQNTGLVMELGYNYDWTDYIGTKTPIQYRSINIWIPNNILSDLSIITTNGTIQCNEISLTNSITLDVNNGEVNFSEIDVLNTINLFVKNGNINGSIIGSYDIYAITCNIKKGNSNLPNNKTEGSKKLNVTCNNGNVSVNFANKS